MKIADAQLLAQIKDTDTGKDCLLTYFSDEEQCRFNPLDFQYDGDNFLHLAVRRGDYRAVELILKAGVDVNQLGDMGETALHYAMDKGWEDIVRLLLAHGASREIRDEFGKRPGE